MLSPPPGPPAWLDGFQQIIGRAPLHEVDSQNRVVHARQQNHFSEMINRLDRIEEIQPGMKGISTSRIQTSG